MPREDTSKLTKLSTAGLSYSFPSLIHAGALEETTSSLLSREKGTFTTHPC